MGRKKKIVTVLRADKGPIGEVAKYLGVSEQIIYTWRERFGAMDANEVGKLPSTAATIF